MSDTRLLWVTEVHNVGGFFGGDTITLSGTPWPEGEEETLTIDEKALENIVARHMIMPEMLLQLELVGERVDRARLLAGRDHDLLNDALRVESAPDHLDAPRIRAYRCLPCDLWVIGQPTTESSTSTCAICRQPLA